MGTFLQHMLGESAWTPLLLVLIDAGLKGLVLLVAATLTTLAMQRSSAAARHLVWMLALVALLALPLVTWVAPQWQLAILPAPATTEVVTPPAAPRVAIPTPRAPAPDIRAAQEPSVSRSTTQSAPPAEASPPPVAVPAATAPPTASRPLELATGLLLAWLALALLVLAPLVMGHVAVLRLQRRTPPFADSPLTRLTNEIAKVLGIRQPVRIHRVAPECMPMAAGVLRAAVFLPASAETWPEARQRVVLLHELAHIKRRDCLTHALARFVVALHWFNPLAWYALRRLRIEREHACDDLVLAAGERPADYAENLLEIARNFRAGRLTSAAAITMAKKSHLEGRLLAVLDAARRRGVPTPRITAGLGLAAAAACAVIAACQLTPAEATGPSDRVTFATGATATLLGVGIPTWNEGASLWRADGTPLDKLPDTLTEEQLKGSENSDYLIRAIEVRVEIPADLSSDGPVSVQIPRTGTHITRRVKPGRSTVMKTWARAEPGAETFDIEVGIASGAWEPLAETIFGNAATTKRNGENIEVVVSQAYDRDGAVGFTVTHNIGGLDYRVLVTDPLGARHTVESRDGAGTSSMKQNEYTVSEIPLNEIRAVSVEVRDFDWMAIEGVAATPDSTTYRATRPTAQSQERDFAATYANGLQARVLGVGEPDGYTVSSVWAPDGAPLPGPPEGFKSKMGGSTSDKSGLTRRFFIEVSPVPEESDLGIKFKVEGNSVAHIVDRSNNRRCVNAQIYNTPDKPGGTTLELGIAAGPWESVHGTNGPHSTSEGSAFGAAYSDFFEKDGKAHVVVTHTPREDNVRLVVFDRNDTPYPTREESSSVVGGMRQTEFVVEGEVSASDLVYMDLQARPYEWKAITGIAMRPSEPVAPASAEESSVESPRMQIEVPPSSSKNGGTQYPDGLSVRIVAVSEPTGFTSKKAWRPDGVQLEGPPEGWSEEIFGTHPARPSEMARRLFIDIQSAADSSEIGVKWRLNGQTGGTLTTKENEHTRVLIHANLPEDAVEGTLELGLSTAPWSVRVKGSPYYMASGGEFGVAFSGLFEKSGIAHAVVTHSGFTEEYRLVAVDKTGARFAAEPPTTTTVASMFQSVFRFPPGAAADSVVELEFQVRPFTWRTISGIALYPDDTSASTETKEPGETATAPIEFEDETLSAGSDSPLPIPLVAERALNPDPEAILAMLREEGIENVTHYHDMTEAWALEEVGLSCRPDSSGKLQLKGMPYAPRLLAFPDGAAPRDAMQQLREAPERLIESEEWTATLPFQALTLFAALNDKGETWFLLFDTDDTQCRNVYLWPSREDQAILDAQAWVDELMIPQDQLAWGEVNNGLQAAVLLKSPKDAYPLKEAISMAFVLRNASDTRIELVTSEWRDDYTVLATTPNNEKRESNASIGTGFRRVQRIKLAPGQVVEIRAASCAFVSEDYDWMSDGKITAALTTQPGIHKVQFAINFANISMRSGKGAPQPGDWEGTLTTGIQDLRIAEQRSAGADAGPAAG